ncbi:hypothetical protein NDU88_006856 [Pleurodeles waltl]|uniref:Uncharacterized protein n=1 Tax=Pleurodeles waltl TaxID=8319 RepID=A0AAV7N1P4_PLEWA|nr:hypothetical protein NDU88_006856 [Pleurodeles waltl]
MLADRRNNQRARGKRSNPFLLSAREEHFSDTKSTRGLLYSLLATAQEQFSNAFILTTREVCLPLGAGQVPCVLVVRTPSPHFHVRKPREVVEQGACVRQCPWGTSKNGFVVKTLPQLGTTKEKDDCRLGRRKGILTDRKAFAEY